MLRFGRLVASQPCHMAIQAERTAARRLLRRLLPALAAAAETWKRTALAAIAACSIGIAARNVDPGYPYAASTIARLAARPSWGCTGYRHPNGYVDGRGCLCGNGQCSGQQCHAMFTLRPQLLRHGPRAGLLVLPVLRLRPVGRPELQLQPGPAGCSDGLSVLHTAWSARFSC